MQRALSVRRAENFPAWYQAIVRDADLAEPSPVRGSMIVKPWGYGVWEEMQRDLDRRIRETGHDNCYFPLLIPLSFIAKEAQHVEGFAKEVAIVTHHRLKVGADGELSPDPEAKLEEPLVVRPTSETIIGDAFSRWIKSYRDLPVLLNQWANVVRWELRTRLFLRTSEFLWQEGHTAHASEAEAREETLKMLGVYADFARDVLAMPVITGEKTENERFPGAVATYSIEAMMQDGKALQAGTSHYLGQNFARAQQIRFQDANGELAYAHTTSWGVSTRMVGGVIMTHGDDDGLRLPPAIAPRQVVIVPILRDKPEDAQVMACCESLLADLLATTSLRAPTRAMIDRKPIRSAEKRWAWIKRGAPLIVEIGLRDVAGSNVTFLRRDRLREGDKVVSQSVSRDRFVAELPGLLAAIQKALYDEAKERLDANVSHDVKTFGELGEHFGAAPTDDEDGRGDFKGWVRAPWSRPSGTRLKEIEARMKGLKLTLRNVPTEQTTPSAACLFTGEPAVEEVIIARAY